MAHHLIPASHMTYETESIGYTDKLCHCELQVEFTARKFNNLSVVIEPFALANRGKSSSIEHRSFLRITDSAKALKPCAKLYTVGMVNWNVRL